MGIAPTSPERLASSIWLMNLLRFTLLYKTQIWRAGMLEDQAYPLAKWIKQHEM